jgi:hypothetical protein
MAFLSDGFSASLFESKFYGVVLAVPAVIISYCLTSGARDDASRTSLESEYVLKFADGASALFEVDDELYIVRIGSSLLSAGEVVAIEKRNGHWTVSTSKRLTFVLGQRQVPLGLDEAERHP